MQAGPKRSPASPLAPDPIDFEQEEDGRWIAEILSLPGAMVYGATRAEAASKVQALARLIRRDRAHSQVTEEV